MLPERTLWTYWKITHIVKCEMAKLGLMRVSFIIGLKNGRIDKIIEPLAKYSNRVIKFDISRRRAIVKADIFGKERKLKFGLWTEDDTPLPRLNKK